MHLLERSFLLLNVGREPRKEIVVVDGTFDAFRELLCETDSEHMFALAAELDHAHDVRYDTCRLTIRWDSLIRTANAKAGQVQ